MHTCTVHTDPVSGIRSVTLPSTSGETVVRFTHSGYFDNTTLLHMGIAADALESANVALAIIQPEV